MEAGDVQSDLDCIENFASHFGFVLLPRLLRIREKAVGKELRATLETTTERLAREHPEAVREGLHDDDPLVVRGALRILVGLGAAEAIPETMRLLDHGDTRVRLGAVEVLVALGAEPGLEALVHALDDEVREVRVAALWGLATWQHSPALSQLVQRIDAKAFRYTESDEKMAILDAYARIGGEAAVEHLGKLLNARSMFKAKEPTDVRACAARALGSVGSPEAKAMLSRAQGDRDPEVRRAVQRSLRKVGVGVTETTMVQEAPASLQKPGLRLLTALYAALQSVKLYPIENDTVQASIEQLRDIAARLLDEEGTLELRAVSGGFLLNLTRIRLTVAGHAVFGAFERCLANHEIDAITLHTGVRKEEWAPFLGLLLERAPEGDRFEAFERRLKEAAVERIVVRRRTVGQTSERDVQSATRVYARSVQVAREVLDGIRIGRAVNARKVKRSVQGIVDQVLNNQVALLGMTAMRDFDEYTFTHSVNVCILCVVLGQRLGLEKRQLYELGLCGLLHDIGKARIDSAIINKPGALDEKEWQQMRLHPREGLLALFQLRGFAELPLRQMLAAYEHHMKLDLTGYPKVRRTRRPSLFTRVVSVVDTFDAVSSARSYRSRGWPPDKVLLNMRDEPGWGLDRVLVKAFITATGIYPVGTVVSLTDKQPGDRRRSEPGDSGRTRRPTDHRRQRTAARGAAQDRSRRGTDGERTRTSAHPRLRRSRSLNPVAIGSCPQTRPPRGMEPRGGPFAVCSSRPGSAHQQDTHRLLLLGRPQVHEVHTGGDQMAGRVTTVPAHRMQAGGHVGTDQLAHQGALHVVNVHVHRALVRHGEREERRTADRVGTREPDPERRRQAIGEPALRDGERLGRSRSPCSPGNRTPPARGARSRSPLPAPTTSRRGRPGRRPRATRSSRHPWRTTAGRRKLRSLPDPPRRSAGRSPPEWP